MAPAYAIAHPHYYVPTDEEAFVARDIERRAFEAVRFGDNFSTAKPPYVQPALWANMASHFVASGYCVHDCPDTSTFIAFRTPPPPTIAAAALPSRSVYFTRSRSPPRSAGPLQRRKRHRGGKGSAARRRERQRAEREHRGRDRDVTILRRSPPRTE